MINNGIYTTLTSQVEKLRKHNRQGSIKTKERYYQAMLRFCRYLANEWRLQKLANIAPKHIEAYLEGDLFLHQLVKEGYANIIAGYSDISEEKGCELMQEDILQYPAVH